MSRDTRSVTAVKSTSRGFTLIELLIVVAIVAVLTRIAYPSYIKYIIRTSREAAQSQLLELASSQEKIFLNSNTYTSSVTNSYTGAATDGLGVPSGMTTDSKYQLSIPVVTTTTFTLKAAAVTGSTQVGDGDITINEAGIRTWGTSTW
jgi:type IV pilus assembly protein PilE